MQLSNRSTVPQATISRIERGSGITLEALEKLAQAMGHHPTEFFKPRRKS
jgi:transcriptional regulator with XRE-family HTH domain